MSFNKITIVGYLGRDPELRYTPQGTAVCNLSVATTEKRRNARGETEEHTIWFHVSAWGRQAEVAAEYLAKGRQVYVEGGCALKSTPIARAIRGPALKSTPATFTSWASAAKLRMDLRRGPMRTIRLMKRRR